ncbi:MAG TPA: DUF4232 domain-containing protein [Solirubrobacteraceae bacterium]|nr:DUF4232 domain-containing protein [Solirubrobacteraceae bacterium]
MSVMSLLRWRRTTRVACGAVALVTVALVCAQASARGALPAAVARCTPTNTQVWLGLGLGGGTAGSTYYPLEFSNIGHHACTLNGFPGVSAEGNGGGQVGPAAGRNGQHHSTVTLAAGATAHAILRVVDWGALCSTQVPAIALRVYAPGETRAEDVPFSFGACAHKGVLIVGPVRGGVGIPGYTTS